MQQDVSNVAKTTIIQKATNKFREKSAFILEKKRRVAAISVFQKQKRKGPPHKVIVPYNEDFILALLFCFKGSTFSHSWIKDTLTDTKTLWSNL